ncbi:GNAT family N-acetyltransferase [Weissella coleopterorum]|uniref:GNAT family N-acetyltransferase n=1 Tax=Weissella coleopterorum TaxID=2714949 RepID=A0A6G8B1X0_9LACO|nr:GNAT family N-acetyltransferase [Weissella coleopterorum]QIL51230.1 GNAT family N-acetyltransferase [Weissella coleopterorum]
MIIKSGNGASQVNMDALLIRDTVFIGEQGIDPALEHDQMDYERTHFVGYLEQQPVVTGRINANQNSWHLERVATLKNYRGRGFAQELLKFIMDQAQKQGIQSVDLNAQMSAQSFYFKLGFEAFGQPFYEAGLEHIKMHKNF